MVAKNKSLIHGLSVATMFRMVRLKKKRNFQKKNRTLCAHIYTLHYTHLHLPTRLI